MLIASPRLVFTDIADQLGEATIKLATVKKLREEKKNSNSNFKRKKATKFQLDVENTFLLMINARHLP